MQLKFNKLLALMKSLESDLLGLLDLRIPSAIEFSESIRFEHETGSCLNMFR